MKVLLNDVSGEAHRGEILAVLGPSGSGKSTLIDALANRIFKGSLNGMITLSGEQLDSSLLRAISAYIMQDHLLFPMLTVEETLTFAAELRLLQILSKFEKKKRECFWITITWGIFFRIFYFLSLLFGNKNKRK
ncbi:unnamed protein product [Coffea canephora]|uniref:ABC transporter domain-containing protein n=1 Tax=Coffea canephora TaxID=49390 RepID=A0A068UDE5_COFCA|nr:unnamed protein product [Coffea canephora]